MSVFTKAFGVCAVVTALPAVAMATTTTSTFTIAAPELDMALLGTLATAVLTGLAALWLLRKVIKTMNKS